MSVLIKGMEMPKSCSDCEIRIKCGCRIANASGWLNNKIDDHCPFAFAEVPTPHGRLIDADELLRRKGDAYDSRGHLLYAVGTGSIVTAPTIIEAEE